MEQPIHLFAALRQLPTSIMK